MKEKPISPDTLFLTNLVPVVGLGPDADHVSVELPPVMHVPVEVYTLGGKGIILRGVEGLTIDGRPLGEFLAPTYADQRPNNVVQLFPEGDKK